MDLNNTIGHVVCHLRPDQKWSRHSEGDFVRLQDGAILFIYSRFTGTSEDDAPSELVAMRSTDEGETWSTPETFLTAENYATNNIMSVSIIRRRDGDLGVFFGARTTPSECSRFLALSCDEGKSVYRTIDCTLTDRRGYYVLNNDRVERLRSGRLIMPLAFHRGGYQAGKHDKYYFEGRGVACFWLSDDDGETWHESADILFPPFVGAPFGFSNQGLVGAGSGLQEPGVIELQNGVLWAYFRTNMGCQYESFSLDEGEHWTVPQPSRFTSPNSPLKIDRMPDGGLMAIWNPIPVYNGRDVSRRYYGRTPLVCAISRDDGRTWSEPSVLEGDPNGGFCYPAIFFTGDHAMLTAYCSGRENDGDALAALTIRKVNLPEIASYSC